MENPDALKEQTEVGEGASRSRAEWAVARIRERAKGLGLDALSMDEIDQEIRAAREARKRRASDPR